MRFSSFILLTIVSLLVISGASVVIGGQQPGARTLFDEIDNDAERRAFREVWDAPSGPAQRDLAVAFVTRYPRSVLLREAYELAARASLVAGDRGQALLWAARSLRLIPENPFLLVMVADVAAKESKLDLAEQSARDALRYLTYAAPPAPITARDWPRVHNELRGAAYLALGHVAAARHNYTDARRALLTALSVNPDETEALYVLATVQLALNDASGAAASYAEVSRRSGPLAAPAREALRTLHRSSPSASTSFETYAASLTWNPPAAAPREAAPAGKYAGSLACRECHARAYDAWQSTGMAKMLRPYRPDAVAGDFSGVHSVSNAARPVSVAGRHFIDVRDAVSDRWVRYPVDYIIGSKWQQAYATRLPDASLLVFPIQFSISKRIWLNYWAAVDAPGSERADIRRFHERPDGAVYQTSCAPCHTSQLRASAFEEPGINCEMCHGPSLEHVNRIKAGGRHERRSADPPITFSRLPAEQYALVCAQCHAQSAVHDTQNDGSVNFSAHAPFYRTYPLHLASSFSRKAFYRDGRHSATTFISEAFGRSQCFRTGSATCGSCHNPHPTDAPSNPTSLKYRETPDMMCLQCHSELRDRPERHTRHAPASEGSRCVSCHMPRIMDALLFPARSHQIDDVPDVEMTERFGQKDSPNACLMCHQDKTVSWLKEEMKRFTRVP